MHHLRGNAIPAGPSSKIRHGEDVPGPHLHAKLHGCGFKNVVYMWENCQNL